MKLASIRGVAFALAAAIGAATASTGHAAPGNQIPPKLKVRVLKSDVLVCNPHPTRNYLIVRNHHAAKTFPKGSKIFYLARSPRGVVARGWYTLKRALKPGHVVRIRYGSWPLPRTRKANYCRTYIKYYA